MSASDTHEAAPPGAPASAPAPPEASWLASLQGLLHELPGLLSDRVELLSLELQRAGQVLAQIVALVVAAAILGVTAWLALWGGVVAALIAAGLHWAAAALIVLAINLAACWLAVARVRALAPALRLPATRRHLTFGPQTPTPPPGTANEQSHDLAAAAR